MKHNINPKKIRRRIGYLKAGMDMPETSIELPPFTHSSGIIKSVYKVTQHNPQQQSLRTANSLISIDDKGNFFKEAIFPYFLIFFLKWRVWRVFKVLGFAFMWHNRDSGVSIFQATTYGEYLQVAHFYTQISIDN